MTVVVLNFHAGARQAGEVMLEKANAEGSRREEYHTVLHN